VIDPTGGRGITAFNVEAGVAHVVHFLPNGGLEEVQRLSDPVILGIGQGVQVF
jgi:hypothetical protein